MSAGSILQKMMDVAAGRVRHIGGEWNIFPGCWQGPAFSFGRESLCGPVQSVPVLGIDELNNRITGTYTTCGVARDGAVGGRFAPTTKPAALEGEVEKLL